MLVGREMDYALRILRALSRQDGKKLSAAAVARQEHMPKAVTLKIMKRLHDAGIVQSSRGAGGGYRLARPCAGITLYDLFSAMGTPILINRCQAADYLCENLPPENCGICREFSRVQTVLNAELRRTPLDHIFAE